MTRIQTVTRSGGFNPKHDIVAAENPVFWPNLPPASLKRDTFGQNAGFRGEKCHVFDACPLERHFSPRRLKIWGLFGLGGRLCCQGERLVRVSGW